jgi:hypothetical protein
MDPFVTLANRYVDTRPGLGHSALPNAPQLPADDTPSWPRFLTAWWRRLVARRSRQSVRRRPSPTRLPVRSEHVRRASDTGRVSWRG